MSTPGTKSGPVPLGKIPTKERADPMETRQRVSLVVPLFNESARWNHEYWEQLLEIEDVDWLFVDDGSTDQTKQIVERFTRRFGGNFLHLGSNLGKGNAVRAGMNHAIAQGSSNVGFVDGDGAFALQDVQSIADRFLSLRSTRDDPGQLGVGDEIDSVWASRVALAGHDIVRRTSRHYLGRVIATLISTNLPNVPYDTQCGFKIFRVTRSLQSCLESPFKTKWFFDVEILQRWILLTGQPMNIQEIPLLQWHDVPGSKIRAQAAGRVAREVAFIARENQRLRK